MPRPITAVTGIDAISHAVESFVCLKRNPVSQLFGRKAWTLLSRGFPLVLRDGTHLTARGSMLLGAHLAGAAIENSMLGATHALANPLSAHFDLTHGIAIGILLPHVVRYNSQSPAINRLYGQLAEDAGLCQLNDPEAGSLLAEFLLRLVKMAGLPLSLFECHVSESSLPEMAAEAAEQWTGKFNPRPVDVNALLEIYQWAFHCSADRS
jgi:alcohol dehydrogenase